MAEKIKVEKFIIKGHEDFVDGVVSRRKEIESLQAEQKKEEQEAKSLAVKVMIGYEQDGKFTKTCFLAGSNQGLRVTRANKFSKIDEKHEANLKRSLGKRIFDNLFDRIKILTLKKGQLERFLLDAQKAGLDVSKYFDFDNCLYPQKGYLEKRGALRPKIKQEQNEVLDKVTAQAVNGTRLSIKG